MTTAQNALNVLKALLTDQEGRISIVCNEGDAKALSSALFLLEDAVRDADALGQIREVASDIGVELSVGTRKPPEGGAAWGASVRRFGGFTYFGYGNSLNDAIADAARRFKEIP